MKELQLGGILIRFNPFLLLVFIFYWIFGFLWEIIIVFGITFLHELSHTIVARYYNIQILEIELFPLGGVVRLKEVYHIKPIEEMIISLAGPMINILFSLLSFILIYFNIVQDYFFHFFMFSNIIIGGFNLIPVFPLDGGRILRAYLSRKLGNHKATLITIGIGKLLSLILFVSGAYLVYYSYSYLYVVFIAIYIYHQSNKERQMSIYILVREILHRKKTLVKQGIMDSKHLTVMETVDLKTVFKYFSSGKYHYIGVINSNGELVASITESQIIDGISIYGGDINLSMYLDFIREKETS
ncbi:site-2 protease family protein [Alkaliphilus serpentinus]|uniref:CBS domain-containing protein n=1 Tax=Alkaliphilus serpentinus TaxID=1482731 RepID=A0A833HPZ5_9FIRM|nr:site-2 protease family protein [Alkaliphilus serpentinus]KAB3531434.1 hypothetical protein F8153_04445 [Alkaliphilus serpentinus]